MNNSFSEQFKNWSGYTRRERRSTFILLILILSVLVLRYSIPGKDFKLGIAFMNADSILSGERPEQERKDNGVIEYRQPVPVTGRQYSSGTYTRNSVQRKNLIDINTCDSADLERLPGIGPVLSARIIKYRNLLGGFSGIVQLKEVYGLTTETFDLVSGRVTVDTLKIRKIKINTADYRQLLRFPYFEKGEITAILKYRELMGKLNGIGDLVNNKLISSEKAGKIVHYLDFGN